MVDLTVNVPSFEDFLAEDTKELAHKGHSTKNGDGSADKVDEVHSGEGSDKDDPVEKSDKSAPGDGTGESLEKPPGA